MKIVMRFLLCLFAVAMVFSTRSFADDGADTFKSKCATCHGADGKGSTAMGKALKLRDLSSADVQKQSDADMVNIVTNGKDKMPKYDGKLTKEQINDVVKYVRTLK
jgi:cytochrome c6